MNKVAAIARLITEDPDISDEEMGQKIAATRKSLVDAGNKKMLAQFDKFVEFYKQKMNQIEKDKQAALARVKASYNKGDTGLSVLKSKVKELEDKVEDREEELQRPASHWIEKIRHKISPKSYEKAMKFAKTAEGTSTPEGKKEYEKKKQALTKKLGFTPKFLTTGEQR